MRIWLVLTLAATARSATLGVGPGQPYAKPCAAFAAASPGDSIEIDAAGDYSGDVCAWRQDGLTIRGVNGRARIDAAGHAAQGKAIWVIQGNDTVVENVELSGAAVPDLNGAGIRQEGRNLTVRNCFLHDNQDGILAGDSPGSQIILENTELASNGAGDGFSHNIYINHVAKFTMRFCYSHHAKVGHLVKSRAAETYLLYNRFSDEETGTASYEVNLPNGGRSVLIGNIIEQGPETSNGTLLTYRDEGAHPSNPDTHLIIVNNTFINNRTQGGTFLAIAPSDPTPALIRNNIFWGRGQLTTQAQAIVENNLTTGDQIFRNAAKYDFRLRGTSAAVDAGADPGGDANDSFTPAFQYRHPACGEGRRGVGVIDIGAYEFGGEVFDPEIHCPPDHKPRGSPLAR